MQLALLSVGPQPAPDGLLSALEPATAYHAEDPAGVDAVLDTLHDQRLVLHAGELAGLNLALTRLMRRGLLADLDTAVLLPAPPRYLRQLGLPADLAGQLAIARQPARLMGVLKDDSGGLCIDSAELAPWQVDAPWWVRAMVDDQPLCDGQVRSITVHRLGPDELAATVRLGRFRQRTCRGRSLQLACDEARIVADEVARERPRRKRTFWSEPKLWRLALPG